MPRVQHCVITAFLMLLAVPAQAGDTPAEKFVASLRGVDQVKGALRSTMAAECAHPSCEKTKALEVCNLVGALDLKLDRLITDPSRRHTSPLALTVPEADLQLLNFIWKQCRPTTYQTQGPGTLLNVWYEANPRDDALIRRALGLVSPSKEPQASPSRPPAITIVSAIAPLEPDAVISEEHRGNLTLQNHLVQIVGAKRYRCNSISAIRALPAARGYTLVCNRSAFRYDIEDKGGSWQVTVQ